MGTWASVTARCPVARDRQTTNTLPPKRCDTLLVRKSRKTNTAQHLHDGTMSLCRWQRFWEVSIFLNPSLHSRNSTRKPLKFNKTTVFLQTPLVNPLVFTMHLVCTLLTSSCFLAYSSASVLASAWSKWGRPRRGSSSF